jgi:hypothetical protein
MLVLCSNVFHGVNLGRSSTTQPHRFRRKTISPKKNNSEKEKAIKVSFPLFGTISIELLNFCETGNLLNLFQDLVPQQIWSNKRSCDHTIYPHRDYKFNYHSG